MKPTGTVAQNDGMFPMRPFRTRQHLMLAAGGAIVVAVALLVVLFLTLFSTSAPQKLAIRATTGASVSASPLASGQAAGSWVVARNSVAGYRVREQLAFVGAPSDAVGRTSSITGSLALTQTATGYQVDTATFSVDVNTLTSDRAMRDQRIHSIGLQSDRYPTATFKLTSPITLPATASDGQPVQASAIGDLTIHGTTQKLTLPDDSQAQRFADRSRRLDHIPLQPVRHHATEHRGVRQRPERRDHGIPPLLPAGIGVRR